MTGNALDVIMRRTLLVLLLLTCLKADLHAQSSFKVVFKTYPTGTITRTYLYDYDYKNEFLLWLTDSIVTYASKDSMVLMTLTYPVRDKMKRSVSYLDKKKRIIKTEQYIQDYMAKSEEWKYDTLNRITYHSVKETGSSYNSYVRTYTYNVEKTSEGTAEKENCYHAGHLEFATTDYYDKKHCILKQVRQNDAGKTIHVETYTYDKFGRLSERELYFPEFGVTKHYKEDCADAKCHKIAVLPYEKVTESNIETILKKELIRYKVLLLGDDCEELEYKLINAITGIEIKKKKDHYKRTIAISIKERVK